MLLVVILQLKKTIIMRCQNETSIIRKVFSKSTGLLLYYRDMKRAWKKYMESDIKIF